MTEAVVLNKSDVRKIIAEYYGVEIEKVLPSKYSFTVIKEAQFMSGSQDVSYNKMEVKDGRRTQD